MSKNTLIVLIYSTNVTNVLILHRLSMFENRVLKRIFAPKRDEVVGCYQKLHNEKLHNL
jgi:hypothetical protein